MKYIQVVASLILATLAFGASEEPKTTPTQLFYDKVVASNLNEPSKAYDAYQASFLFLHSALVMTSPLGQS